jgi:hypothetical protein
VARRGLKYEVMGIVDVEVCLSRGVLRNHANSMKVRRLMAILGSTPEY